MIVTYGNHVLSQQQQATGNQAYPLRYKGIWICLQVRWLLGEAGGGAGRDPGMRGGWWRVAAKMAGGGAGLQRCIAIGRNGKNLRIRFYSLLT